MSGHRLKPIIERFGVLFHGDSARLFSGIPKTGLTLEEDLYAMAKLIDPQGYCDCCPTGA